MAAAYHRLDEALDSIADAGPDLRNGLTNHAPMAIEALCAMDRGDAVWSWLDQYRSGLLPRPDRKSPIASARWVDALGDLERFSDWRDLIASQLREGSWRDLVSRWAPRLASGFCASATHGVLRTAHAVRALSDKETRPRLEELADGLAYWASSWQSLPTRFEHDPQAADPRSAIMSVPIVPEAEREFAGTITSSLSALDRRPEFARVINRVAFDDDPLRAIASLTQTFARVYLANAHDPLTTIVFIHTVTSTTAMRSLIPYLDQEAIGSMLRYGWQAGCALYATFGTRAEPSGFDAPTESREELIQMAVRNGDEHVIKFTEACLREYAVNPAAEYLAAARHAMKMLGKRKE